MQRALLPALVAMVSILAACGGGSKPGTRASGTTTTTDASAYLTAYTVCLQFDNTEKLRNAVPQGITDREADDVLVGLALQLKPALKRDPRAWSKLNAVTTTLRTELLGTKATDQQIDDTIEKVQKACAPARKPPTTPSTTVPPTPSSSTV